MNEQLETHAAGAADLQVDLDERRFSVVGGGAHTVSRQMLVKLATGGFTVVIGEQQPIEKTETLTISRIADELNYCNKQPRKTAQWKNEQRRFRK